MAINNFYLLLALISPCLEQRFLQYHQVDDLGTKIMRNEICPGYEDTDCNRACFYPTISISKRQFMDQKISVEAFIEPMAQNNASGHSCGRASHPKKVILQT